MVEFRQFVQEQHSPVTESNFSRTQGLAAAYETSIGNSIVGRPKGTLGDERTVRGQRAANAVDLSYIQCFLRGHWGQN